MGSRFSCLLALSLAAGAAVPATAAQFQKSGAWAFDSLAVATDGEAMLYACTASTESAEGTALSLTLAPAAGEGFDARLSLSNRGWALGDGPVRVRFTIGADQWVLPGEGADRTVEVSWTGDAGFLTFLENLAASSFAGLTGGDGTTVAQFSLNGSRGAIEAMKACAEEQIGKRLGEVFEARATDGSNPF